MTDIAAEHRVVLIRIPRSAPADGEPEALYRATRQWWRIGERRTDGGPTSPTHALSVVAGRVVAAYEIDGWQVRTEDGRRGFSGRPATGPVADYVGTDVSHYFPAGAANPVRFVNCDGTPGASSPVTAAAAEAALQPVRSSSAQATTPPAHRSLEADIGALVRAIDAEPLAHVMFGHRELFHTNLLAWFFEALPEAADRVFAAGLPRGEQSERRVRREHQHLDLVVEIPGHQRLVIENKVFAVYDPAQLEAYAELVAGWDGESRLVLLSLLDPRQDPVWRSGVFDCPGGPWHYLSYDELALRIIGALDGEPDTYEVQTMRHYARLVRDLHRLVAAVSVQSLDEAVVLPQHTADELGTRQLAGSLVKLRARHVAQLVGTALAREAIDGTVGSGFTNGQPLVEWFTDLVDDDEIGVTAGWQLQGGSFRRALILEHLHGTSTATRAERYAYAAAHSQWFDFAVTDGALGTAETPIAPVVTDKKPHGFNRYDPDFVYRSKKVPGLTVRQLIDAALAVARSLS